MTCVRCPVRSSLLLLLLFAGAHQPYQAQARVLVEATNAKHHEHQSHSTGNDKYFFPGAACLPYDSSCRHMDPRWHALLNVVPHDGADPPPKQPERWAQAGPLLAEAAHRVELFNATAAAAQLWNHGAVDEGVAERCAQLEGMSLKEQIDAVVGAAGAPQGGKDVLPFTLMDTAYSAMAGEIEAMMRKVRLSAPLFIAMDEAGWTATCLQGRRAVRLPASEGGTTVKARVEYSKFLGSAMLLDLGHDVLLFESDVWMLAPLLHLFADPSVDLFLPSHLNNPGAINIGLWYARPERGVAQLFRAATATLEAHPELFDQDVMRCLVHGQTFQRPYPRPVPQEVFQYPAKCGKGEQEVFSEYQNFGLTVRVLPSDAVACSVAFGMATNTLAVHVLTSVPLTDARRKQIVAKELGFWVGDDHYYDGRRKYLALDGWISSSVSNWEYNRNGLIERAWLTFLTAAAVATNRTLILPPLFIKSASASAVQILDFDSLPLDWRPTSFLHHPEVQAVAKHTLFPMTVLRATEGIVEWSSWRSSADLEVSLQAAGRGKDSKHWTKYATNGEPPEDTVWAAMLHEVEVHSAELLVLDMDFRATAIAGLLAAARPGAHAASEEAQLLQAVSSKATWCKAILSGDMHAITTPGRMCT
mmetsp:Transcript_33493/g.85581  ORF Transcript_33493/g.85581 Transcript_33493/m.85581 type:complete len:644 (+) Transcript_33493:33-1964(+)